jgi:1,4-dihydroxy-2-naphthoate polyprenyltransferase
MNPPNRSSSPGAGIWRLSDPKISLASIAAMTVGAAAAAATGPLAPGWLVLTVVGILSIEVAKNASGEVVDFDSGVDLAVTDADRSPFSGGKRVIVGGLLSRRATIAVAVVAYALGIAIGAVIATGREPRVWALGIVGVALAFFYHAPPLRLSYRGLGEIAVAACYGPLIACGTTLVQRGSIDGPIAPLSICLGVLIAAFLVANEFPDFHADAAGGKRTLVVRLGKRRASGVFAVLSITPFVATAAIALRSSHVGVLIALAGLLPAIRGTRTLSAHADDNTRVVAAQRDALLAFLIFAVGGSIGLLI